MVRVVQVTITTGARPPLGTISVLSPWWIFRNCELPLEFAHLLIKKRPQDLPDGGHRRQLYVL
jgi:hypothetical protein